HPAAHCQVGQAPAFQSGFATLKRALGEPMGNPTECEHPEDGSGDTVQQTSSGLARYRPGVNATTFTNGFDHWALTGACLVHWTGDATDPPADAPCWSAGAAGLPDELRPALELLRTMPAPEGAAKPNMA